MQFKTLLTAIGICGLTACSGNKGRQEQTVPAKDAETYTNSIQTRLNEYAKVKLTADLSHLSANQKQAVKLMIEAGGIMNDLYWYEAYGNKGKLLDSLFWYDSDPKTDIADVDRSPRPDLRAFIEINYGPWDRLDGNSSFVKRIGSKPKGANFYPADMTVEEFENWTNPDKKSPYTFVRRDKTAKLITVPYHEMFSRQIQKAAGLLRQAADLAETPSFKKYLRLRAEALLTDKYFESDMAWMDVKNNPLEVVIGPIENYEDQLFGFKSAHEAFVLIKDLEWSKKLERFVRYLPDLQKNLPAPDAYKQEKAGTNSDLGAYDAVFYAGDCNAGSKTIAINLPNDEKVQMAKGSRRLQLKNIMRAKYDKIMVPINKALINEKQQAFVNFDAFFSNTMFHEVAHGLGIKNTITGKGTVREALKDLSSTLEEGKADVLGIYMIQQLAKKNEIESDMKPYYTTFLAGIFRSIRFGASSAHGRTNMIRFNYFKERGAFSRSADGKYTVDYGKFAQAVDALSKDILVLQGDGDYAKAKAFIEKYGSVSPELQKDLDKLSDFGIPRDIVFEQGIDVLGL
ncbi:MAG: Zn-dependent hydrolase [Cytophagales bacterium]|nr:Zn-dependent hydrolase [Cytophagales bacterium]